MNYVEMFLLTSKWFKCLLTAIYLMAKITEKKLANKKESTSKRV